MPSASDVSASFKPKFEEWKLCRFRVHTLPPEWGKKLLRGPGKPDVSHLLTAVDGDIHFAQSRMSVPVIGKTESSIAGWQQPDSFLLTCYLNRDALLKALDAEITALSAKSDANAMTVEQRERAIATIMANMLAVIANCPN